MKVENQGIEPAKNPRTKASRPVENETRLAGKVPAERSGSTDTAYLSEVGRLLAKARLSLEEVDVVRSDRVEALREQISQGTYPVPIMELARRLSHLLSGGEGKPDEPA